MGIGPDCVRELRLLAPDGERWIGSGYFDNTEALIEAIRHSKRAAKGYYISLNPVAPALLARGNNRLRFGSPTTTADADVVRRQFILLDFDPKRPSGISSSEQEHDAALAVAVDAAQSLRALGIPVALELDTGNGAGLLLRVDLSPDDTGLVRRVLSAAAFRFNEGGVQVDLLVSNPARLCRLAGTKNRKGDSTEERPHRRARVLRVADDQRPVEREALERFAANQPPEEVPSVGRSTSGSRLDVDDLLSRNGISVAKVGPWQDGTRWVLEVCPFNPEHTDRAAYVIQFRSGAMVARCQHASCGGKEWSDFRALLRHPPQAELVEPVGGVPGAHEPWCEPEEFGPELLPVLPFDPEMLPEAVRGFVQDVADRIKCPIDFVAISMVVAMGVALGLKLGVRLKTEDDWQHALVLWAMGVGLPSSMKSPAFREAMRLLMHVEEELTRAFEEAMESYHAQDLAWRAAERCFKAKHGRVDGALVENAKELLSQKPTPPPKPRLIVRDATIEKLGEISRDNPNGYLLHLDELNRLFCRIAQEERRHERAFYLQAYEGKDPESVDRISRGSIAIPKLGIWIFGGIQPGPLANHLRNATGDAADNDGFFQRFQLAVYPDQERFVYQDRAPDREARERAQQVLERLHKLTPESVGAEVGHGDDGPYLRLDPDAQPLFRNYYTSVRLDAQAEDADQTLASHLLKTPPVIASIALIFHLADGHTHSVCKECVERALRWVPYLRSHIERIYGACLPLKVNRARFIAQKIRAGKLPEQFTVRELQQRRWPQLRDAEAIWEAIDLLAEMAWVRMTQEARPADGKRHGPSKKFVAVNPLAMKRVGGPTNKFNNSEPAEPKAQPVEPVGRQPEALPTSEDEVVEEI